MKTETDGSSSINSNDPDDGAVQVMDSLSPESELPPSTEKEVTTTPDTTNVAEENIPEIDLIVSVDSPKAVRKLSDSDEEKFITVLNSPTLLKKPKITQKILLMRNQLMELMLR